MLLHWIWFAELKDISLLHKHRLLERFGDPEELYRMSEEALLQAGLPEKEREALSDKNLWKAEQIAEEKNKNFYRGRRVTAICVLVGFSILRRKLQNPTGDLPRGRRAGRIAGFPFSIGV